ncbi:hypothetical protein Tco_0745461 [Tanacetum coccineum]
MFHVSNLKKCHIDEPLVVPLDGLHIDDKLYFIEENIEIRSQKVEAKLYPKLSRFVVALGKELIRDKKYAKLTEQEKLQDDCDVQALNIVLQGTELSYQEHECKLFNEFDKFTSIKGESLHEYYLRFAQLINDMHTISMTMQQVQVNTKFLNALQPKWSKLVTDVKLAKNIYPDPLALVANHQNQSNSVQYPQQLSSIHQTAHPSQPYLPTYEAPLHPKQYQHAYQPQISHPAPSVPQNTVKDIWQAVQITIPQNVAFQADDLDAYDSDCDDISSTKAVLMANISSYDSDVLSEEYDSRVVSPTRNAIESRESFRELMLEWNKIDIGYLKLWEN